MTTGDGINSEYITKGMLTGFGLLIVGLLGWMGMNVADIPVIKSQMANIITYNTKRIDDLQARMLGVEETVYRGRK